MDHNEKNNNGLEEEKPSEIDHEKLQEEQVIMSGKGISVSVPAINLETIHKNSWFLRTTTTGSPKLQRTLSKPRSGGNCLCSPTTHAGSFRCRFHRNAGMLRGGSIGSNLSELAAKSRTIRDLV